MPFNYKTELERYRRYYQSLEPLINKNKSQNYTAVIFSFLVVSLFGLYAIRPTIQTILTLKREIQDKTELSQKMEDKIAALIEAQAAYSQIEPSLPIIDQALPSDPQAIGLIIQIRNLASASNVVLATTQLPPVPLLGLDATMAAKPNTTPDTKKPQSFEFTISVVGPYAAIQTFLTGLTEMRRIVAIESVAIANEKVTEQSASDSSDLTSGQLALTLNLLSYYLIE